MAKADSVLSTPPTNTPVDTTHRFETLKDAENALTEQGFKLVPDTCNWIDDAAQIGAGVYPVEEAYGVSKYRIEYRALDATPTRRRFLSQAAGVAVGGTVLAVVASPPVARAAAPAGVLGPADPSNISQALRTAVRALQDALGHLKAAVAGEDAANALFETWERGNPEPESKRGKRRWIKKANAYHRSVTAKSWQLLMAAESDFMAFSRSRRSQLPAWANSNGKQHWLLSMNRCPWRVGIGHRSRGWWRSSFCNCPEGCNHEGTQQENCTHARCGCRRRRPGNRCR